MLFSVWLPLRYSSVAPFAMLKVPVLVPPVAGRSVPALTLTVPVLLKTRPRIVAVFDCLVNVPPLLKVPAPLIVLSNAFASTKLPLLLKMLDVAKLIALLPLAVLPDQVVSPAFTVRPPLIALPAAPLMASVLAKVVLPVPNSVPAVHVDGPATARLPVPPSVPPDSSRLPIEDACVFCSVPALTRNWPVPVNDCTVTLPLRNSVVNAPSRTSSATPGSPGFQFAAKSQNDRLGPTQLTIPACADPKPTTISAAAADDRARRRRETSAAMGRA